MIKQPSNKSMDKSIAIIETKVESIENTLDRIEKKIDNETVRKESFKALNARVGKLESMRDWAVRIVIGAIILGLLGLVGLR